MSTKLEWDLSRQTLLNYLENKASSLGKAQAYFLIGIVQTAIKEITLRETTHSHLHCSVLYSQRTLAEFVLIINIAVLCTSTVHSEFLSKARKHNQEKHNSKVELWSQTS